MARVAVREPRTSPGLVRLSATRRREIHCVSRPGRPDVRIDTVLVTPTGIHVITDRADRGAAADDVIDRSRESAAAVAAMLPPRYRSKVVAVCRPDGSEPVSDRAGDVMVASAATFEHVLRASPVVLSTSEVNQLAGYLEARLERFPETAMLRGRRWGWRTRLLAAGVAAASATTAVLVAPEVSWRGWPW